MRYIVVGASAAGISGAKTLRELDKDAEIILVSKDENVYSRCILHHYISGHRDIEALDFTDRDFFEKYNIEWKKGLEVKSIDDREHVIGLSNGESLKYDKILLATGASAFIPPVENLREAKNVVGLRNLEDAIKMGDRVLPIQLDKYASSKYEKRFEDAGVKLKLGVRAEKVLIDENKNPKALLINTGEEIPCELIIVATGVRSNVAFLKDSSIETDRFGLIINEKGETNARDVYGAGDITGRNPIWPTAVKEGIIAANNMVGNEIFMEDFFGSKNTMNFLGLTTMSLGVVNAPDDSYTEEIDISGENYKKIIHKDGKIYGAIIQGDLSYAGVLTQLIKEKIHVSKVKKPLFEIDYADFFNIKENLEYTY